MNTNDLAGGETLLGENSPEELLAGEAPLVTDWATVVTNGSTSYAKFEVVALTAANAIAKYDPAEDDGTEIAVGILAQPIPINSNTKVPYFCAGFFNHEALVWPAGVTTLAARKAAFLRTPVFIGSLSN
jgi:hypothetical protein